MGSSGSSVGSCVSASQSLPPNGTVHLQDEIGCSAGRTLPLGAHGITCRRSSGIRGEVVSTLSPGWPEDARNPSGPRGSMPMLLIAVASLLLAGLSLPGIVAAQGGTAAGADVAARVTEARKANAALMRQYS